MTPEWERYLAAEPPRWLCRLKVFLSCAFADHPLVVDRGERVECRCGRTWTTL